MRPASRAQRPASTAARMLRAISTGSRAFDTAVLSSTAEQPSSMASAASEAVPMPASSTTGTGARAQMSSMRCGLQMPSPEPIGAPSGLTAAAPASASLRQTTGSSVQYGSTMKPFETSVSVARTSSSVSGYSSSRSPITSSLIQLVSSASRASSAVSTASFAVWQPAVLGKKLMCFGMRSTRLSSSPARLMRRMEAVTISVALAAMASSMSLRLGYPAVPRKRREPNSRPAMIKGSDISNSSSAALTGAYDFDAVAGAKPRLRPRRARNDGAVDCNRDPALAGVDRLFLQQGRQRRDDERLVLPVDPDVRPDSSLRHCSFSLFRSSGKRPKSLDAEGTNRGLGDAVEHEARDGVGGDRRQQNSVAVVTGGVDEPVDRPGAEDRRVVATARSMADPHLIDRQFLDRRHRPPGGFEQGEHAARGQRRVVSLFLDRRAHQQATIAARDQIGRRRPNHVAQERGSRVHA